MMRWQVEGNEQNKVILYRYVSRFMEGRLGIRQHFPVHRDILSLEPKNSSALNLDSGHLGCHPVKVYTFTWYVYPYLQCHLSWLSFLFSPLDSFPSGFFNGITFLSISSPDFCYETSFFVVWIKGVYLDIKGQLKYQTIESTSEFPRWTLVIRYLLFFHCPLFTLFPSFPVSLSPTTVSIR